MEDLRKKEEHKDFETDDTREVKAKKKSKLIPVLLLLVIALLSIRLIEPMLAGGENGGSGAKAAALTEKERKELEDYRAKYSRVETVRKHLLNNYYKEIDQSKFQEGMIRGMLNTLEDPYTVYFNEKEYKEFNESSSGEYGGLGVTISPAKTGYITVISTFPNSPAREKGMVKGDEIIKVEGTEYSASEMDIAISRMRGEPGTDVTITVRRGKDIFDLKLTRAIITVNSVNFEYLDKDKKIGYIKLNSFDDKITSEFKAAYNTLLKEGMKGFVLDLRQNPGGSLYECVNLADILLGEQVIVNIVEKNNNIYPYKSDKSKIELPYVVLIDDASASASEILAGAIKDSKSAPLIGVKSFGKGLVQSIWPMFGKDGIKITTAEYTTTNGTNIHGKGVTPDIEVKPGEGFDMSKRETDNQLKRGLEELIKLMK